MKEKYLTTTNNLMISILILSILLPFNIAYADPLDNLRNAIKGRESDINNVEAEINKLQVQVSTKKEERMSLQETVSAIASEQKTLERKINAAESNVSTLETKIEEIEEEIQEQEKNVAAKRAALKSNLKLLHIANDETLVEGLLKYDSLAEYWQQSDSARRVGQAIDKSIDEIRIIRENLDKEKEVQEQEKSRILTLQQEIEINKQSVDIARSEQERLLGITKNQESTYQSLLDEKKKLREAFESDLAAYEAQLTTAMNPASIPQAATTNLAWPLSNIVITQNFGNTAFAASGAYNGNGHNGIDLDLEVGTPVLAAANGVVKGVGNTDAQCPNASYGRWILLEHPNGLSTLYAHLSNSAVSTGQQVAQGQVIGYGGNTGYSTGSHLHFTVYASEGVRVGGLPSRSCPGTTITLPLADVTAYLNPRNYLP